MKIISTLQGRESSDVNSVLSQEDGLRNLRSIYVGILSIILTLVFRKNAKKSTFLVLLILIIFFYGLDIHLEDLKERSVQTKDNTSSALDILIKQKPTDMTWYDIDYRKRNSQYNMASTSSFPRKVNAVFNPNWAQRIFYILPWISIYFLYTYNLRRKYQFLT